MRGWLQWAAAAVVFEVCIPNRAAINVQSDAAPAASASVEPAAALGAGQGCTCNWCPGYEAQDRLRDLFAGIDDGYLLQGMVCPPLSACPEPPSSPDQAFNYCYGQDHVGTKGTCNCETGRFLREDCDETLRGEADAGYVGCQTKTRSGLRCQSWSAQSPHKHTRTGRTLKGNFCRNPSDAETIWCFTEDRNVRWQYCDPLLGRGFPEWVDPDTPQDARVMRSRIENDRQYGLVFSDEFEVSGRIFDDGHDPRWTALSANPFTTQQVNTYSPDRAHTKDGRLKIEAKHLGKASKTGRAYETAMLQTWNKFCFTGGVVDMVVKLPGKSGAESAGLWPAAWLMGNLGRAIHQESTEGVWPFSPSEECPEERLWTNNSIGGQRLSACSSADRVKGWKKGYDKARGSPEIDMLEVKLGSSDYQYETWYDRVAKGRCDPVMGDAFNDVAINPLPFAATSFQLAPGIPAKSKMRPERLSGDPHEGCIWPLSPFNWYYELWPSNRSTYPSWDSSRCLPAHCPTFPNLDDFGNTFDEFQLDTFSAITHLAPSSFEDQGLRIRLEWRTDVPALQENGSSDEHVFLAWYIDDMETPVYQLHSGMLGSLSRPYENWELLRRGIPSEASYLLLNIDMSPDWGWPICHGCDQECRSCVDCANPKCLSCRDEVGRQFMTNLCKFLNQPTLPAYEVDHVRVYSDSATCEPHWAPTKDYIGDNADRYFFNETSTFRIEEDDDPLADYPLLCVRAGGGWCTSGATDACGGPERGRCVDGRCACNYDAKRGEGWTGAQCLARAAGPSRSCPFFLEHDQQSLDSRQFLPPDNCAAPFPEDHPGIEHSIFTPSSGSIVEMVERNCKKVYAFHDHMVNSHRGSHEPDLARRVAQAVSLCNLIWYDGVLGECCPEQRANISLKAWGELVMNGAQCCNLPGPPYCIENQGNWEMFSHVLPLVVSLSLIVFVMVLSTFSRPGSSNALLGNIRAGGAFFGWVKRRGNQDDMHFENDSMETGGLGEGARPGQQEEADLTCSSPANWRQVPRLFDELTQIMSSSFIGRDFPNEAGSWATIFGAIFGQLAHHFGFQDDSVKNQFQHLLSLWQSQVSFLRDRDDKDEGVLEEALEQMADKLLDGFDTWKGKLGPAAKQFHVAEPCPALEKLAALPGEQVAGVGSSSLPFTGRPAVRAVECAIYLLVWGEAGNLRFCPDMILFLIDSIRLDVEAAIQGSGEITKCPARPAGTFLRTVIRPMYNAVFDETYDSVAIDPRSGEDKKKQQAECVRFAPPDKANHDDWNELFHDIARFNDRLLQQRIAFPWQPSGSWTTGGSGRLSTLQRVDWQACLGGFKTHREVHSFLAVFAALHRVIFLHVFAFVLVVLCSVEGQPRMFPNGPPITGRRMSVRISVLGILAPAHMAVDALALRAVCPNDRRRWWQSAHCGCMVLPPVLTYLLVRILDNNANGAETLDVCLTIHFVVSGIAAFRVLFIPDKFRVDRLSCHDVVVAAARHCFWLAIFAVKCAFAFSVTVDSTARLVKNLEVSLPAQNIYVFYSNLFSPAFDLDVMVWGLIWFTSFICFAADTLLWVMIAYCILGLLLALRERSWALFSFFLRDAVETIDGRFKDKLLAHYEDSDRVWRFNTIWNAVCDEMWKEHKLSNTELKRLQYGLSERRGRYFWTEPRLFERSPNIGIRLLGRPHWLDTNWPRNPEAQWRLRALARALTLRMPRPFRVPHVPGLTVLIPHYNETILQTWDTLCEGHADAASDEEQKEVILLRWILLRYPDEWTKLIDHSDVLQENLNEIEDIQNPQARQEIEVWASMRTQTLFRTVSGICTYDTALRRLAPDGVGVLSPVTSASSMAAMADANAESTPGLVTDLRGRRSRSSIRHGSVLQDPAIAEVAGSLTWRPDECFRCLVAMQRYAFFNDTQLEQVETMLAELPSSLAIAYIDYSKDETPNTLRAAGVHEKQHRRYFACLFDKSCDFLDPSTRKRRKPRYRVELPGFPILGNGKGDNQNCAVIFSRGEFIQAIDANQGGYLEQMFLLPNLLGEFREDPRLIVGTPEHIISDFGSIGDFAASAELTFGTLVQRSLAALGGRMHYGHPDVMNKLYMMHQGGVSKATQTIHLSEDIFAGMDFVLRGGSIRHREYFHVAKGRDLGFNAVLSFFSKLSNGTGEQLLTRQVLRLCRECGLERVLPIYYNHAGYYLTQFLFTFSVKMLGFAWVVIAMDCIDGSGKALNQRYPVRGKDLDRQWEQIAPGVLVSQWLSELFGPLFLLLILSTSLPLLMELWIQEGLVRALVRLLKQFFTLAPLHFIFQGKVIGNYIVNNIRYGGAKYIATGRELPTHRKPFVGPDIKGKTGLYEDFAAIAHYDGIRLLFVMVCIGPFTAGSVSAGKLQYWWLCISLVVVSWLWAPYWFNPYQFSRSFVKHDCSNWWGFFVKEKSRKWREWYTASLEEGTGLRANVIELIGWLLYLAPIYALLTMKLHAYIVLYESAQDPCWGGIKLWGGSRAVSLSVVFAAAPGLLSVLVGAPLLVSIKHFRLLCREVDPLDVDASAPQRRVVGEEPSPLLCAAVVSLLTVLEIWLGSCSFWKAGWNACAVNVLVYKVVTVEFAAFCAECWLRLRPTPRPGAGPVLLWLRGFRLLRDTLTSTVILLPLLMVALVGWILESIFKGRCDASLHNFCVFRSWGDYRRRAVWALTPSAKSSAVNLTNTTTMELESYSLRTED